MKLENLFEFIAKFNYQNKGIVIIATIVFTLICSIGLINLRLEIDPQNLWVAHSSIGY
jgi:predicted RND superfamily exporter protein